MPRRCPGLAAALVLVLACACKSAELEDLDDAFDRTFATARAHGGFHGLDPADEERLRGARAKVLELHAAGTIVTPDDQLCAAFVLCSSRAADELELAHELALAAANAGDERGWPIAAESLDRALVLRGVPQRFGTQIAYEPVLGRYALLPVDPSTTDEERLRYGLPGLAELRRFTEDLNDAPH